MSNRIEINTELFLISPLVARLMPVNPYQVPAGYFDSLADQISSQVIYLQVEPAPASLPEVVNPYQVPEGYFENMPDRIMQRIRLDEAANQTEPKHLLPVAVNTYQVPEGYFENLPGMIMQRIRTSDGLEDKQIAPALLPEAVNPYQSPEGYFDKLPDQIMQRIRANEAADHAEEIGHLSPFLSKLNKPVPFNVPTGYFDDFAGDLVDGVRAVDFVNAELDEYSSLLASLKSKNVYRVPAGYFDSVAGNVLEKIKSAKKSTGIVRSLPQRIARYSVAAMIAGVIALGVWLFSFDGNQSKSPVVAAGIEKISNEEMVSYLEQSPDNEAVSTESYDLKEEDVKELIADLTDDELKAYLDQNASSKDLNN